MFRDFFYTGLVHPPQVWEDKKTGKDASSGACFLAVAQNDPRLELCRPPRQTLEAGSVLCVFKLVHQT